MRFSGVSGGMTEAEPHLLTILRNRMLLPAEQRNEQAAVAGVAAMQGPLKVLDGALKGRDYLLGKDFTIADLNLASVTVASRCLQSWIWRRRRWRRRGCRNASGARRSRRRVACRRPAVRTRPVSIESEKGD